MSIFAVGLLAVVALAFIACLDARARYSRISGLHPSSRQLRRRALRVRAAFLAAAERSALPLVRDAWRAAAERCDLLRRPAAVCACLESERLDAEACGSRFSARLVAVRRRALARVESPSPWPRS
ncbi:MAG TPA: hypothetical protein VL220_00195 [Steroidobacteraceae bacterium]|nr:hypothetical protein [Steroidobacteraceae bacterium]